MCVGVLPNQHRARGGGDGLSESQSTGPTIHWRNTPQSTGRTLLNPLAQHSSIHWPNTPQSTGPTLLNPPSGHRLDPPSGTLNPPAVQSTHVQSTHGTIWADPPAVRSQSTHVQSTGRTNLNPPSGHRLNPPSGTLNPPAVQSTHVQSTHGTIWADPPAVLLNPPTVRLR